MILWQLFLSYLKIGFFGFGGGYAMLSLIQNEVVVQHAWMTNAEFADIVAVSQITPGPIAINCATYTGYKQRGVPGAIVATAAMVLPSFLIILLISLFFEQLLRYEIVVKAFAGIRVAVAILIIQAAVKMIQKMMRKTQRTALSIAFVVVSFGVVFVLNLLGIRFSTIYLILIAGALGYVLYAVPKQNGGKK